MAYLYKLTLFTYTIQLLFKHISEQRTLFLNISYLCSSLKEILGHKIMVSWDVMPCTSVRRYQHFRRTGCLHNQRYGQQVLQKCWYTSTKIQSIISR